MRRFLLLFPLILGGIIHAQITVTKSTFPAPGDTLFTIFAQNVADSLLMGNVGGPQVWDFSTLSGLNKQQQIFVSPTLGNDAAQFPEATMLSVVNDQEQYYKSSDTKVEALGFGGENPFFPAPLLVKYTKRPVIRRAPLTFIQTTFSDSEFKIDFSSSIIPDTLLAGLPIKPDSFRIEFVSSDRGLMDAYGTLKLGSKTFPVLREKVENITETKLKVKVLGAWIDPSIFLGGGGIPGGFGNFLGKDTTYTFNFYSNDRKEVIVSSNYNVANEFLSVEFVDLDPYASSAVNTSWPAVSIYPNPVTDKLYISAETGISGRFFTTISDVSGRVIYFDASEWNGRDKKEVDTSRLSPGTYFLQVMDQYNKSALSAKFVK